MEPWEIWLQIPVLGVFEIIFPKIAPVVKESRMVEILWDVKLITRDFEAQNKMKIFQQIEQD